MFFITFLCRKMSFKMCLIWDEFRPIVIVRKSPWWRHEMETFSALLSICAGNSPVPGEFPTQRRVTRSFDVYFDLRQNKRLSKQSWGWWFETLSWSLWRHCNIFPDKSLGPFQERFSIAIQIRWKFDSAVSHPRCNERVAMKFRTWHDSICAVVACAKFVVIWFYTMELH